MATNTRFVAKNGLDNSGLSITNLGAAGSALGLAGGHSVTLTTTGVTSLTLPTSGTLLTTTGNAASATILQTARTLSTTGDATGSSAAFDGSANASIPLTLATVNSNVGTFGSSTLVPVVTVNAKGLVTAVSTTAISASWNGGTVTSGITIATSTNQLALGTNTSAEAKIYSIQHTMSGFGGLQIISGGTTTGNAAPITIQGGAGGSSGTASGVNIIGGQAGGTGTGGAISITGGTGGSSGSTAGTVTITGGPAVLTNMLPGLVTIAGGPATHSANTASAGGLVLRGGDTTATNTATGGNVQIRGGNASSGPSGHVLIHGGVSNNGGAGGYVAVSTGPTSTLVERLRILNNGAWSVGTDGTTVGTAGQVLTSNGNTTPSWQAVAWTGGTVANAVTITSASPQLTIGTSTGTGTIRTPDVAGAGSGWVFQLLAGSVTSGTAQATRIYGGNNTGGIGGILGLHGGNGSTLGGDVIVTPGTGATEGGGFVVNTGGSQRLRINAAGAFGLGDTPSYGSAGQVLTSQGSAAQPTWTTVGGGSITLTGDVAGSGTSSITTTLANTTVTAAAYGSATQVPTFTVDSKGRLTAAANETIALPASAVTSGAFDVARLPTIGTPGTYKSVTTDAYGRVTAGTNPTTLAGYGITDATPSSHVGAGGTAHADVIAGGASGFMTGADKTKLNAISGTNTGDQTITLTGDVTGSGTGSFAATLANTAVAAGSYGSATQVATFTVDSKGRLTAAGNTTIAASPSQPLNQIVYGTGSGIASSTQFNFNPNNGGLNFVPNANASPMGITLYSARGTGGAMSAGITIQTGYGDGAHVNDIVISGGGTDTSGKYGGGVQINGGYAGTGAIGGNLRIAGGTAAGSGSGGNVELLAGRSATGTSGEIIFGLAIDASSIIERMRIVASTGAVQPGADGTQNLGTATRRWNNVFASVGTIQTSDRNLKEQETDLSTAERNVAVAAKAVLKKFKYKDAVAAKGASARWHFGIVAQDLEAAFTAEGLDAREYGVFTEDSWYEVNGEASHPTNEYGSGIVPYTENDAGAVKVTRLGVRYEELLAFIIASL